MRQKEKEVFAKIFGNVVASETYQDKTYLITVNEDGTYACNCPDFIFRKGSYTLLWNDGEKKCRQKGCKHIAEFLAKLYGICERQTRWGTTYIHRRKET